MRYFFVKILTMERLLVFCVPAGFYFLNSGTAFGKGAVCNTDDTEVGFIGKANGTVT